jgi:hypothetical protein
MKKKTKILCHTFLVCDDACQLGCLVPKIGVDLDGGIISLFPSSKPLQENLSLSTHSFSSFLFLHGNGLFLVPLALMKVV